MDISRKVVLRLDGARLTASKAQFALYRMLGSSLLRPDAGLPQADRCAGVALSRQGVIVLLREEAPALATKLAEVVGAPIEARVIGDVVAIAGGGDSIGSSIAPRKNGTFGCLVKDFAGRMYALTCDHVVGHLAGQSLGDEVWSPGSVRGGGAHSRIGSYYRGSGVTVSTSAANTVDAALVELDNSGAHSSSISGLGLPIGFGSAPALGDILSKSGDRTGVTSGELVYIATLNVSYPTGKARFVDQLGIERIGGPFAARRDSGAVVLDSHNEIVGLLFSAAPQSNLGWANPIDAVALTLGVSSP